MAQPSETHDSYDVVGGREDLSDIIYNISPTDTPFMSMAGRGRASAVYHEWQTDSLAAVAAGNAVIEGDDATNDAIVATVRHGNYCQISDKVVVVSGTAEAVDKAGRKSELAYLLGNKAKELKRDMETILIMGDTTIVGSGTGPQSFQNGSSTIARRLASCEAWLKTNTDRAGDGADPSYTIGPNDDNNDTDDVDGTQRALQESMVKSAIQSCWTSGGDPTTLMSGPKNKQNISAFTGASTRVDKGEDKRLTLAVDILISDFGEHKVVANRFSRDRSLLVLTPSLWEVDYLRSFRQYPLAKTGDSEKRQLVAEYTLNSKNEAGSGIVADLTTT